MKLDAVWLGKHGYVCQQGILKLEYAMDDVLVAANVVDLPFLCSSLTHWVDRTVEEELEE